MGQPAESGLLAVARGLEQSQGLGRAAAVLERILPAPLRAGTTRAFLAGRWLGHSLHPLLTDFPLGFWASASLLDLVAGPDASPASRRLVGFGLLAAVPTAVAGASDWTGIDESAQRVGIVHASLNATAFLLYATSYLGRHRGWRSAVPLGIVGGLAATAGGFFGGHLTLTEAVTRSNRLIPPRAS